MNFTVEMTISYLCGMPGKGALTTPSADLKTILLRYASLLFCVCGMLVIHTYMHDDNDSAILC